MKPVQHRRPRVLVCDQIAEAGIEVLQEHVDVDVATGLDEEELSDRIGDYEAVIVRSSTKITSQVIERAERLQVIARAGAGLDTIDVAAAVARRIEVINSPDANTVAVAELTMALVLSLARNIPRADAALKQGRWEKSALMGAGLTGKTLGIVGFGRIGQAVATRAQAFGMRVVANQHRPTPELYLETGVEPLDLYDLLSQSDFVTLHLPARDDTEGLIGAEELTAMQPSAYLINTSRGSVIDEAALLTALDAGTIAGAALDVFIDEPATDSPLARHPLVVATPHLGASTEDAQTAAAVDIAHKLVARLAAAPSESVLPLRFVDLDRVVPHEATDPRRAARLAERIVAEKMVRNPPIVARVDNRYVVLDGATRSAALAGIGCRHVVVQDVDVAGLSLETWHHVVRGVEVAALLEVLTPLEAIRLEEVPPSEASARALEYGGICSVTTLDDQGFVIYTDPGSNRFDRLAAVAGAYIGMAVVSRTLERDLTRLMGSYPDLAALVEYPQFTVEQVLLAARSGRLLPAGVTRFVIPGRVLRLDISLDMLSEDRPVAEKNRWLHDHLAEKERKGQIRYYREPVYLLDE